MAAEPTIRSEINGLVKIEFDPVETLMPAADVYDAALEMIEAVYQSRAIKEIDRVMALHRGRFVEELPEWGVLDAAWRDLRAACGFAEEP